jgi:hypothetical protein
MKTMKKIAVITMINILVLSFGGIAYAAVEGTGSAGALKDQDYTVQDMLTYALQDEYAAKAEYEAILKEFGDQLPYTNIVKAEENHINRLVQLFQDYGYVIPDSNATAVSPKSLEESYQTGITTEENNIAMYEKFLNQDLPSDVKLVFERLKRASENHLKAFQNAAEGNLANCNGTCPGNNGQGCRQNRGQCNESGIGRGSGQGNGCQRMNRTAF